MDYNFGCGRVLRLSLDFDAGEAHLYMLPGRSADMTKTIEFCENLDINIVRIFTYAGDERDTTYFYVGDPDYHWISITRDGRYGGTYNGPKIV